MCSPKLGDLELAALGRLIALCQTLGESLHCSVSTATFVSSEEVALRHQPQGWEDP